MRSVRNPIFSRIIPVGLAVILVTSCGHSAQGKKLNTNKMIREIINACQTHSQIPSLTETYGAFSINRAYRIQAALAKEFSKEMGPVIGYKVAYASKTAQKQFGVNEPASGPLFLLQRVPSGSKIPADAFVEFLMETEIAFTIGKKIDKEVDNVEKLTGHVKWVHTAFDVGDYRFVSGKVKPTPQDMIASGVGAHFHVLGPAVDPAGVDVDTVKLKLVRNGKTISESAATNVMGSPWNSLFWLANHVVKLGGALNPGDVVITGTAAPAYKAKGENIPGDYEGDCGPLGKITLTID
jgi:2-keto-4-pentenoate hydratase